MENGWIIPNGNLCINDIKCALLGTKGRIGSNGSDYNLIRQ